MNTTSNNPAPATPTTYVRYCLVRDDAPTVRFYGERLAEVSDQWRHGQSQLTWCEIDLYRTRAGKLICQVTEISLWQGCENCYTVLLCTSKQDLIAQLGHGDLAKKLYDRASIDAAIDID